MVQKGQFAESAEVGKFYWVNKMAPFYFPKEITKELDTYYDACHWLACYNIPDLQKTYDEKEKIKSYIATERHLSIELEEKIKNFLQNKDA